MSQAPHTIHLRNGVKMGDATMVDTMLVDGLTDVFHNIHMGVTGKYMFLQFFPLHIIKQSVQNRLKNIILISAENIAKKYSISREEQDEYAAKSQQRTENSIAKGYFDKEIVPVPVTIRKNTSIVAKDEFPKPGTTTEDLAKLRPVFVKVILQNQYFIHHYKR